MAQATDSYPYICVLDFEATCDNNKNFSPRNEVIEFASVLLKLDSITKTYTKISEIQNYCKPLYNTTLTKFCKELTGITQDNVDVGIDFIDAVYQHKKWLVDNIDGHEVIILTCGNWDLQTMMSVECRRWNIDPPNWYRKAINLKDAFTQVYGDGRYSMASMLEKSNLKLEGRHHSGIDDCRNIARIVHHLAEKGCRFDISLVTKYDLLIKGDKNSMMNEKKIFERRHIADVTHVSKMSSCMSGEPQVINTSTWD
jgi:inhibitor of KinA sporulation pathway (predicted exonuclease)